MATVDESDVPVHLKETPLYPLPPASIVLITRVALRDKGVRLTNSYLVLPQFGIV